VSGRVLLRLRVGAEQAHYGGGTTPRRVAAFLLEEILRRRDEARPA
jgi:hypothetical protein